MKRFGLIRNEFLFFFHNPSNDKPIGLIPLKGTQVYTPPNGDNSFETTRQGYNATQGTHSLTHTLARSLAHSFTHSLTHSLTHPGFEFEVSHSERDTLRLYALSEEERVEWVRACESHSRYQDKSHAPPGSDNKAMNRNVENIFITSVRLNGFVTENNNNSSQVYMILTHSLTHSLTYSLTHSLTHSLTDSLAHSLTYSLFHISRALILRRRLDY